MGSFLTNGPPLFAPTSNRQLHWTTLPPVPPVEADPLNSQSQSPPVPGNIRHTLTSFVLGTTTLKTAASGGGVTASGAVPVTFWNRARMSALPAATPVASPALLTVATPVLLDSHVAVVETFSVVGAVEKLAVAVNWTVWPACTVLPPVTETLLSVRDGGVPPPPPPPPLSPPPQADTASAIASIGARTV